MRKLLLLSILFIATGSLTAQNVGVGTIAPDPSAKLDVSATDRGMLVPRVNLASASFPSPGPATSLLVYNTNAGFGAGVGFYFNSGTPGSAVWTKFTTGISNTVGGELTGTLPNPSLAANSVQTGDIQDGQVQSADLLDGGVGNADLRNSAANSVIGRSTNTVGAPADIAGTSGEILRVSGSTLDFGTIDHTYFSSQAQNAVLAGPASGGPGAVTFRALTGADLPTGATGYVQNQNAAAQTTGNFWISGTGRANTAFQTGKSVFNTDQGGALELGGNPADNVGTGSPYIDFHFNGSNQDYDIRMQANGADNLVIDGGTVQLNSLAGSGTNVVLSSNTGVLSDIAQVPIANGGTNGTAAPTAGALAYGTGSAYAFSAAGTSGYILRSGGAGAPTWVQRVPIANGGTNTSATPTAGAVAYGTGSAYAFTPAGSAGAVLTSNGAGAPSWSTTIPYGNNIQSVSGTSSINIASTTFTDMAQMTITFTPKHNIVYVSGGYSATVSNPGNSQQWAGLQIVKDGVIQRGTFSIMTDWDDVWGGTTGGNVGFYNYPIAVTAGVSTTIKLQWRTGGLGASTLQNTVATNTNYYRNLTILD